MAHTMKEKTKLLNRVRRMRGQIEAVERALESEASCADILHLLSAARGAMNGLVTEVVEDHIREHVAHPDLQDDERAQGAEELVAVIRTYLK